LPRLEELENRTAPSVSGLHAEPQLTAMPMARFASAVFTPAQIKHAYGFDAISLPNGQAADGSGQTIAVVGAYDAPNIATDVQTFDAQYGLPDPMLIKTSPSGITPVADTNWAAELTLDVEWSHAIAPQATILLVETASNSLSDLLDGVSFAANSSGVSVVSMSWGGSEFAGETAYDSTFTTPAGHSGVTFVASSGDNSALAGLQYPAVSPNVLAVGGTTLTLTSTGDYGSESAWSGSGGGYSQYETEPAYQTSVQSSGVRTNPDVAYDANPRTGVVVFFTPPGSASGNLYAFGGTSVGAPQWSGLVAIANQGRALIGEAPLTETPAAIYAMPASSFHDITSGSNGFSATAGFDLATGRGTPIASSVVASLINSVSSNTTSTKSTTSTPTGSSPTGTASHGGRGSANTSLGAADNSAQVLVATTRQDQPAVFVQPPSATGQAQTVNTTIPRVSTADATAITSAHPFLGLGAQGANDVGMADFGVDGDLVGFPTVDLGNDNVPDDDGE
jgi:subtilase family serine protease